MYVGDIIRYDDSDDMNPWVSGQIAVIIDYTYKMVARMFPYDVEKMGNQNILAQEFPENVTIIGNIHENPELLNTTEVK